MAINLGLVSNQQAVAATGVSTNSIDLGAGQFPINNAIGAGFGLTFPVAADFTTGDETYTVDIIESDTANLATPTVLANFVIGAGRMFLNAEIFLPLPAGKPAKRYIGLRYNLGGTSPSVTVTAWFTSRAVFELLAQLNLKTFIS